MNFFGQIFSFILIYGYPAIALCTFLTAAGIPLPGVAIVLVAGSLAASGNHNFVVLFVLVTLCNLAGDLVDFYLGKLIGEPVVERLAKHSMIVRKFLARIRQYFSKWSGISIFVTRWLSPALAPTVSVLSGISEYPLRRFLFFAVLGEMVSSLLFLGLGFAFSVNWPLISSYLNSQAGIGVGVAMGVVLIVVGFSLQR